MTTGWEQRLADLGQARELREALIKGVESALDAAYDYSSYRWPQQGVCTRIADALIDGPLAPLLAALSTKQHNHTRFTNDSGATWSSCPKFCPVAIRRALDGPS